MVAFQLQCSIFFLRRSVFNARMHTSSSLIAQCHGQNGRPVWGFLFLCVWRLDQETRYSVRTFQMEHVWWTLEGEPGSDEKSDRWAVKQMKWVFEPAHEIMVLFVLRKLILQTHMRSLPVGLDVWFLVGPFICFRTSCGRTATALARLRSLARAFAGRLCDKYHILMGWLIWW